MTDKEKIEALEREIELLKLRLLKVEKSSEIEVQTQVIPYDVERYRNSWWNQPFYKRTITCNAGRTVVSKLNNTVWRYLNE